MGCGTSKLKGDSFEGVNSSVYAPTPRDKVEEPQAFMHSIGETSSTGGTHSFRATLEVDQEKSALSNSTSSPSTDPTANSSYTSRKEELCSSSDKLSTLRKQWKNRKGVPEPRDPVTGCGLYTGLTRDEVKQYVGSTRPAGSPGLGANYVVA
jgi:hypothetical protein